MAETLNFRTAVRGFHREDVVRYIEYLNSKNAALVNQLRSENQALKDELAACRTKQPAAPSEESCALAQQLEQANAKIAQLEQIIAQQNAAPQLADAELEAYRRAERTERMAKERADQIYRQAAATLSQATVQVDEASVHFRSIADQISAQIGELQLAVQSSKNALQDAAATMYAIQPEDAK